MFLTILMACSGSAPAPSPAPQTPPARPEISELDRLRALGYVDAAAPSAETRDGLTVYDAERSQPGYSLFSSWRLHRADLIDAQGQLVHTWQDPVPGKWYRVLLLPSGELLVSGRRRDDGQRYVMRMAASGEVLWRTPLNAHHDVTLTPEGGILALDYANRQLPEVQEGALFRDDLLTRLSQEGAIESRASVLDMLLARPDLLELQDIQPSTQDGQERIDLVHANALHFIAANEHEGELYRAGNLLMTSRHQDAVFVLDLERGEPVWVWGRGEILGPHDPTLLESGNILLFDNQVGQEGSRVIEVDPRTDRVTWEYRADPPSDFYSLSRGSAQRLDNGNTLIAQSDAGRAFEVTPEGEIVWEFLNPNRLQDGERATFNRVQRLPAEQVEAWLPSGG